jgi:hypothetical protein
VRSRRYPRIPEHARPFGRRATTSSVLAAAIIAALSPISATAARGAGRPLFPWPRCTPLCAHAPAHGPRVTAIYVSTQQTLGRPIVTIDAFAAGIPARTATGQLCYEPHHALTEPGCIVICTTHGRRVGAGVWWLRFRTPIYERYQISTSSSHALVRSYWFGVSVDIGDTSVQGSRQGVLHFAGRTQGR